MRILITANYYYPETIGAGIWIAELARDLRTRGHEVTLVTSLPSYPSGQILPGYKNRLAQREIVDGIEIIRTLTYATTRKEFWPRLASFGTFCASAAPGYARWRRPVDVVYAILPPLPLGVSAWAIARMSSAKLIVNVQDIYPDVAVALNYLTNARAVSLFRRMERWIYQRADRVVVISDGFARNLLAKGVSAEKIDVVSNWADPDIIFPSPAQNAFRRETGANHELLVVYAGGLSHNADLETVIDAASALRGLPILFAIVGDGVQKQGLIHKVEAARLNNVRFFPFQPLDRYGEVLAAADVTLVTLNSAATFASVPSKIYKQMAAARPIIAVTNAGNELTRLIANSRCGVVVPPSDPATLAHALRDGLTRRLEYIEMGRNGREYLERNCSRGGCVTQLEEIFARTCASTRTPAVPKFVRS